MRKPLLLITIAIACCLGAFVLISCDKKIQTPADTKYLAEFHLANFDPKEASLQEGKLDLYVDYSTCNQLGQNSQFFQSVSASLVDRTTAYYSIKGSQIQKEEGEVYTLLRNIEEVDYADLAGAAQKMAAGDCEAVLITDGEYYKPNIAKGHDNDPYLASAFRTWILKGYDIHIISEPYVEPYKGKNYNKKRFYILFTDDRLPNNIYDRIRRTVDFTQFPEVDEFHISASHPRLNGGDNNCSTTNEVLSSKCEGFGTFEIQDWDGCDWGTIEEVLVNGVEDETGAPKSSTIIQMGIDKNSFGCYRIKSLDLKFYGINQEYANYYEAKSAGGNPAGKKLNLQEVGSFMSIDKEEFDKHSKINISFNPKFFDPATILTGSPYNYFKLDLVIGDVQPIFDSHEKQFEFESISQPGMKNVSVASSIKQCISDAKVLEKMRGQVVYSIYIKSEEK